MEQRWTNALNRFSKDYMDLEEVIMGSNISQKWYLINIPLIGKTTTIYPCLPKLLGSPWHDSLDIAPASWRST